MTKLPAVASNYFTECKKCGQDRYHKVLAHTGGDSAKIECEVCHSKKTLKMSEESVEKKAAKKTAAKGTKKPSASRAAKAAEAAATAANARFLELQEKMGEQKAQPYRMASQFAVDAKIEHPKFGVGFVVNVLPDKIEVVFQDMSRHLVQGRK
jgi:hypothetical protein